MQIVEIEIKLPYKDRGEILGRLYSTIRGRIRDVHLFPPTVRGISEIRMEVIEENVPKLLAELKKIIRNGRVTFRILSEA
ncbi:hypothetical protein [Thermococcus sp.]|uniref:hypothetical protein n=1 Tax=Thermococcus sp. TaxID=35749 RepID=UPI002612877B|nr:hypothetical protein [Thermococcus sp.]